MVDYTNLYRIYADLIKEHGIDSEKAIGWRSLESQQLRFKVIYNYIKDLKDISILDVGCGLGDFYQFLQEKGFKGKYTGVDIVPEMITGAKEKYPEGDFRELDIIKSDIRADYVIGSGIMCVKISDSIEQWAWVKQLITRMFELSNNAAIFNFLDSKYVTEDEMFHAFSFYQIIEYLVTISDIIDSKHDYLYYDFTCLLGKTGDEYKVEN